MLGGYKKIIDFAIEFVVVDQNNIFKIFFTSNSLPKE